VCGPIGSSVISPTETGSSSVQLAQQSIVQPLVVAFKMVVFANLADGPSKMLLAHKHELVQAMSRPHNRLGTRP
jgi:hypothetical protein